MFKPFAPELVQGYFKEGRTDLNRFVLERAGPGCPTPWPAPPLWPLTWCFIEPVDGLSELMTRLFTGRAGLFTVSELMQRFFKIGA